MTNAFHSKELRRKPWLLLVFSCLVFVLFSCRSPSSIDLMRESPQAYFIDRDGQTLAPPPSGQFTARMDLPDSPGPQASVWLLYRPAFAPGLDRLTARHCTNIIASYHDGKPILTSDAQPFGIAPVSFARIDSRSTSEFYFKVRLSDDRRFDLSCRALQITNQTNSIWFYLVSAAPQVISGSLFVFLGLLALMLTLLLYSRPLLYFGLMNVLVGFYVLSDIDFSHSLLTDIASYRVSSVFLIFIAFIFFFEEIAPSSRQGVMVLAFLNLILALTFQIARVTHPSFYQEVLVTQLFNLALFDFFALLGLSLKRIMQKRPYARSLSLMTTAIGGFLTLDIYNHRHGGDRDPLLITPWICLLILTVILISILKRGLKEQISLEKNRAELAKKKNLELLAEVDRRTEDLSQRSAASERTYALLEERIETLSQQKQVVAEIAHSNELLLQKITDIKSKTLPALIAALQRLQDNNTPADSEAVFSKLDDVLNTFLIDHEPVTTPAGSEIIDLLSANKRHQRTFRATIGGANVELRISENFEELESHLKGTPSRLILVDDAFIEQLPTIHQHNLSASLVVISERDSESALAFQERFPMLDQVMTLDLPKPILQKLLLTHLMKFLSRDVFGLEKYLMWGSTVQERTLNMREHKLTRWDELKIDAEKFKSGFSEAVQADIIVLAEALLEIRLANRLTSGKSASQKLLQLRFAYDAHVFGLSIDLSGMVAARQDIIEFFTKKASESTLATRLFNHSHAIILNSNGHDRHELILLVFHAGEEPLPPPYFYSFISSEPTSSQ